MGNGDSPFCLLYSLGAPVESINSLCVACGSAPQVCEPADAFWKLVPPKSQGWVGFAVQLGQLYLGRAGTFISITTLAQHKFRIPGLCM